MPDFEKRQELRQRSNLAAAAEEITRVGMKISEFATVLKQQSGSDASPHGVSASGKQCPTQRDYVRETVKPKQIPARFLSIDHEGTATPIRPEQRVVEQRSWQPSTRKGSIQKRKAERAAESSEQELAPQLAYGNQKIESRYTSSFGRAYERERSTGRPVPRRCNVKVRKSMPQAEMQLYPEFKYQADDAREASELSEPMQVGEGRTLNAHRSQPELPVERELLAEPPTNV